MLSVWKRKASWFFSFLGDRKSFLSSLLLRRNFVSFHFCFSSSSSSSPNGAAPPPLSLSPLEAEAAEVESEKVEEVEVGKKQTSPTPFLSLFFIFSQGAIPHFPQKDGEKRQLSRSPLEIQFLSFWLLPFDFTGKKETRQITRRSKKMTFSHLVFP